MEGGISGTHGVNGLGKHRSSEPSGTPVCNGGVSTLWGMQMCTEPSTLAVRRKDALSLNPGPGRGRPRHNVGRASTPVIEAPRGGSLEFGNFLAPEGVTSG